MFLLLLCTEMDKKISASENKNTCLLKLFLFYGSELLYQFLYCLESTLPDTLTLPSACGTRQSPKYTRQRALDKELIGKEAFAECFLSDTRQRLCRVPEKRSAKIYTRQNKNAKKPKNNSKKTRNFFFGEGHHRLARARLHWSRCIFCAKSVANAAGGIRTHDPSVSAALPLHYTVTCV